MYPIRHDKFLNTEAGYLEMDLTPYDKSGIIDARGTTTGITKSERDSKFQVDLREEDRDHLFSLMYWISYTWEGRQFCRTNKAGRSGPRIDADRPDPSGNWNDDYYDDATVTNNLTNKFKEFITNETLINSMVRVQIAANYWTAYDQGLRTDGPQDVKKAFWAAEYQQHMSFITWSLWTDFMDHEFSVAW